MPASLLAIGSSLDTIDLSYNRLTYIHLDAFSMAPSVSTLDLSHNDFLNLGNFAPWPNLVYVQVDANPWDCRWLQHTRSTNPVLFDTFKFAQRFDVLSIRGLPCSLTNASAGVTTEPSFEPKDKENVVTNIPPKGNPHGEIIKHGPKMTLKEPLNVSRSLVFVITVAMGILISHVIILLYNRYRRLQHVPFYRHLSKDRTIFDTITEKSTSFMYEAPLHNDQDAAPLAHIYEEIHERETGVSYDVLNFHRFEMQQIDERDASNDPVYV
ncbi:AGAP004899-PA-like protein [Anopheles sinensis]|uniref:AGAP004899-PA-like protein n=1 Tax=Anopheles sinensis TaxID=74873 RepID=A0A084VQF2_ANOSI|nr:AGAP004899-PA-like protein [Anopheles sinensis]